MNTEIPIPSEVDELSKLWPPQRIDNYEFWFASWRTTFKGSLAAKTEETYTLIGREWAAFANGKDLNPRLMLDWHLHALARKNWGGRPVRMDRVSKYHFTIKKFLRWMRRCQIIKNDPSPFLPEIKVPAHPPARSWTHADYLTITQWAEFEQKYQLPLWLFVLGYHTGMSLTDCCDLRWDEVTLRHDGPCLIQRIRAKLVRRLGARALCTIPVLVGGELWRWLKRLEKDKPAGAVFVHRDAPVVYATKGRDLRRLIAEMSSLALSRRDGRSFRHLRNSFASRLINGGVDSVVVCKMTGHQDLLQLAEYVIPDVRTMQDALLKGYRWAEHQDDLPESPPFLTLPSPPAEEKGHSSLASEAGGAAFQTLNPARTTK